MERRMTLNLYQQEEMEERRKIRSEETTETLRKG